jgi:uncharacterized membrane protein YeaQ/YmgE (transglycosylase-associated protein family)
MTQPARPNLTAGVLGAVVGALTGACAWALLVSVTNYKIGYAAVGVGALTGLLAGRFGGGAPQLPVISAVVGLVGCFAGDLLSDAHQVAKEVSDHGQSISTSKVLKTMLEHPSDFGWPVYKAGFGFLDVVFYAFAAVAAFRLATAHGLRHQQQAAPPTAWQPPTTPPAGDVPPPTTAPQP